MIHARPPRRPAVKKTTALFLPVSQRSACGDAQQAPHSSSGVGEAQREREWTTVEKSRGVKRRAARERPLAQASAWTANHIIFVSSRIAQPESEGHNPLRQARGA